MSRRHTVIVTGVGGRSTGHQILHALSLCGGRYRVVATDSDVFSFGLYQVPERRLVPLADHPDYVPALLELIRHVGAEAILPGTQPEVRILAERGEALAAVGCTVIANPRAVVQLCANKWRLQAWLERGGVGVPKTAPAEGVRALIKEVGFPIVGKPADQTGGSRNVAILGDEWEVEAYLQEAARARDEVVFQEYVGSADQEYTVGVLVSNTGDVIDSIVIHRKLTGLSLGTSRVLNGRRYALSTGYSQGFVVKHRAVQETCERLALMLGARGPLNVQCRMAGGAVKVFEVHPRFSGTTSIRADVGFNEPDIVIRNVLDGEVFGRLDYRTDVAVIRALQHVVVPVSTLDAVPAPPAAAQT